ncbi:MAG: ATP-binding protein [Desulfobacteraceae bacterium]
MAARQINKVFTRNKISLRIFLLFVLCALIPLSVISCISYLYVSQQLKSDAHYRLKQQCKAIGFGIFERLQFLDTELTAVAKEITSGQRINRKLQPYDPVNREGSRYTSIAIFRKEGSISPLTGPAIDHLPELSPEAINHLRTGKSIIAMEEVQGSRPDLYMIRLLAPEQTGVSYLMAKIEPLYLWGIGAEGALPQNLEMVVCQPGKQILVSSFRSYEFSRPLLEKYRQNTFSGIFESLHGGETYISSYWSLFLKHRYMISDWVVILSQSKSSILAPVSNFTTTFLLLILLTFWIITLLAIHNIRKRMQPVVALKNGVERFAAGDLDHRVDIHSGDELEILAEAFNNMGQKLKKSQAMVVQAAKMGTFGQMAAGIVHEIGQPLTSISGYSDLLSHIITEEKPARFISIIQREINRLRDIIDKFRTFSRTSEDIFTPVQVRTLIHQVNKLVEHQLKIKFVQLDLDIQEDLPEIRADQNGLQQVLLNLAMNAIDALEEKGKEDRRLAIRAFEQADHLTIEIEDNGCGIPSHAKDAIFEPFFTTKSEEKGTGLGLAILQSIVHKHNGEIRLATEESVGTCFSITFPLDVPSAHQPEEEKHVNAGSPPL